MRMHAQRGEGRLGFLFAVAVVGVAVFLGLKIIPVRVAAYEFRDKLRDECRMASLTKNNSEIIDRIMNKARELEIPLDKKNLQITRSQTEMMIVCSYEQPIDLKFTRYVYRFNAKEKAPLF
ncbi:MAG TPA: hypothetical protein VJS92_00110 [Candidatus Polarisedimenticolaceae bacterium]|nr:hypothetical protein [Candidatus Polarisedimenticolaceae bacterium]